MHAASSKCRARRRNAFSPGHKPACNRGLKPAPLHALPLPRSTGSAARDQRFRLISSKGLTDEVALVSTTALLGLRSPSTPAALAQADKVVARVNGIAITERDLALCAGDLGERLAQQLSPDQRRDEVINYLVDLKLGAKAAAETKIGRRSTDFKPRASPISATRCCSMSS